MAATCSAGVFEMVWNKANDSATASAATALTRAKVSETPRDLAAECLAREAEHQWMRGETVSIRVESGSRPTMMACSKFGQKLWEGPELSPIFGDDLIGQAATVAG